jgi:hypothetical protein
MKQESRVLTKALMDDLRSDDPRPGVLAPLVKAVRSDRDLNMEFRGKCADIYCKGYQMHLESAGGNGYKISVHEKFCDSELLLNSEENVREFVRMKLPLIKQKMATHCAHGHEIEFEQSLIRANNREPGIHTDYFAVDRQVLMASAVNRLDVLGIHWPDHGHDQDLGLALIEVKYGVTGGVEKIADQVRRYYNGLEAEIDFFADEAEGILRQKLELGLIAAGESVGAIEKLKRLPVSRDLKRVKIVLALVDFSPDSTRLKAEELRQLPFADQIELFHLGYGLWDENADKKWRCSGQPVPVGV